MWHCDLTCKTICARSAYTQLQLHPHPGPSPRGGIRGKAPQNFCLTPPNFSGLKFQWLMIEKYDGKEYQTSPFAINYFRKLLRQY